MCFPRVRPERPTRTPRGERGIAVHRRRTVPAVHRRTTGRAVHRRTTVRASTALGAKGRPRPFPFGRRERVPHKTRQSRDRGHVECADATAALVAPSRIASSRITARRRWVRALGPAVRTSGRRLGRPTGRISSGVSGSPGPAAAAPPSPAAARAAAQERRDRQVVDLRGARARGALLRQRDRRGVVGQRGGGEDRAFEGRVPRQRGRGRAGAGLDARDPTRRRLRAERLDVHLELQPRVHGLARRDRRDDAPRALRRARDAGAGRALFVRARAAGRRDARALGLPARRAPRRSAHGSRHRLDDVTRNAASRVPRDRELRSEQHRASLRHPRRVQEIETVIGPTVRGSTGGPVVPLPTSVPAPVAPTPMPPTPMAPAPAPVPVPPG